MPPVDDSDRARDDITAIVHRYAELLDDGDVEGVVAMFSRATWRSAATGTVLRTPDELRAVYSALVPADGSPPRTRHLMHNLVITHDDGADDATARCSYTVLEGGEPGAPVRILRRRSLRGHATTATTTAGISPTASSTSIWTRS